MIIMIKKRKQNPGLTAIFKEFKISFKLIKLFNVKDRLIRIYWLDNGPNLWKKIGSKMNWILAFQLTAYIFLLYNSLTFYMHIKTKVSKISKFSIYKLDFFIPLIYFNVTEKATCILPKIVFFSIKIKCVSNLIFLHFNISDTLIYRRKSLKKNYDRENEVMVIYAI